MRLFLVICSFAAIINANPQGYNYGAGVLFDEANVAAGHHGSSFSSSLSGLGGLNAPSTNGFGSFGSSGPSFGSFPSGISAGGFGHSSSGGAVGFGSGIGGGFSASFGNTGKGINTGFGSTVGGFNAGGSQSQHSVGFEAPIVHKQFITVSAPEDHETLEKTKHFVIGRPQKNYRVVFIKAPSSSAAKVKLSAEYAPQEEKTVIYVLSKKDSTLEVNDIATPAPRVPSKPEIVFIKYKTEEEAHYAQQQIQAEYEKIQGTSEHTDGGIGQQQSVVGILGGSGDGDGVGHVDGVSGGGNGGISESNSYSTGASSGVGTTFGGGVRGSTSTSAAKTSVYLPPLKMV